MIGFELFPLVATLMPMLFIGLVVAAVVAAVVWQQRQTAKRRQAFLHWSVARGFQLAVDAPWLVERWSDSPFGTGHSRRASNAVTGRWDGRDVCAFDYQYTVTSGSGENRSSRTYTFTVLAVALPVPLSRLDVRHQGFGFGLMRAFGAQDIELESHVFNDAFVVKADSARFAYDVLQPRAQELLLAGAHHQRGVRTAGPDLLVWGPRVQDPGQLDEWLHWTDAFLDLVPRFVWQAHGYDPAGVVLDGRVEPGREQGR